MKNRCSFLLACIGFSILATFMSCESAPTQEELNTVLYTPEEIQSDVKCFEKYAGKTLKEVLVMDNTRAATHNARRTKRQHKKECANQPH